MAKQSAVKNTFSDFLMLIARGNPLPSVVYFSSKKEYPLLFFSLLIKKLKKSMSCSVYSMPFDKTEKSILLENLETTFLGESHYYWLGNLADLKIKEQQFWTAYLQQYNGPHVVLYFNKQEVVVGYTVEIPPFFSLIMIQMLARIFDFSINDRCISQLQQQYEKVLSLDIICLMLEYMQLIGHEKSFFPTIVPKIIASDQSLYSLSSALMARKGAAFYKIWYIAKDLYGDQFWIYYFSDLLWKSVQYVRAMKNNDLINARKSTYRLPFSFVNNDWKHFSENELISLHSMLYNIDFSLKNGSKSHWFDTFFNQFFINKKI